MTRENLKKILREYGVHKYCFDNETIMESLKKTTLLSTFFLSLPARFAKKPTPYAIQVFEWLLN